MPFKDMTNVKVLGDEIYLVENFLSKEETDYIYSLLKEFDEELWNIRDPYPVPQISPKLAVTKILVDRLREMFPEYSVNDNPVFNRLKAGEGWGEHADNAEFSDIRAKSDALVEGEPFKMVDNTAYGIVVYINDDYEGGEIYYVHQGLSHKPKPGDLVIHSSEEKCKHGVSPVKSGKRYGWSSHLGNMIKVPVDYEPTAYRPS